MKNMLSKHRLLIVGFCLLVILIIVSIFMAVVDPITSPKERYEEYLQATKSATSLGELRSYYCSEWFDKMTSAMTPLTRKEDETRIIEYARRYAQDNAISFIREMRKDDAAYLIYQINPEIVKDSGWSKQFTVQMKKELGKWRIVTESFVE
ncbi:hypothetical protein ACFL4W_04995 [Planctomycetota bacterium]